MRLKLLLLSGVVVFGCKGVVGQPEPLEAEVRNVSSTCKTQELESLGYQQLICDVHAEVVLIGDAAKEHPWLAYMRRVKDGVEEGDNSGRNVVIVDGSAPFTDYARENRPLKDTRPSPKVEYRVVAIHPLVAVKRR